MKKIMIAGVGAIVLLSVAYMYIGKYETKIENIIREEIAQTQIKVESVDYSALSDTLRLTNVFFEGADGDINMVFNAKSLSLADFNTDIRDTKEEMPLVFGEFSAQDVSFDFKNANQSILNLKIDSLSLDDYAHNIMRLKEEYEKKTFSESFFKALLNYAHSGAEINGYKLTIKDGIYFDFMQTNVEKVIIDDAENPQFISIYYENLEFINDAMNLKTGVLDIDDWQIPNAKKLADATQQLLTIATSAQNNTAQPQLGYDEVLTSVYDSFSYEDSVPFSHISVRDMKIILSDELVQDIENRNISMESLDIELEFGDGASAAYAVKNLAISPDYFSLIDADIYETVSAFITDDIMINVNVENIANLKTNMITSASTASFSQLFDTSGETIVHYKDQNIWRLLLLSMPEDPFDSIAYKSIKHKYTDKGFIPLVVNIGAVATGLPMEALVQQLKNETAAVANFAKTGDAKFDDVITDTVEALLAMFEKPGALDVEITFDTPRSIQDILENMPKDFEFDIDVEQGDKTIAELTPEALLNGE